MVAFKLLQTLFDSPISDVCTSICHTQTTLLRLWRST